MMTKRYQRKAKKAKKEARQAERRVEDRIFTRLDQLKKDKALIEQIDAEIEQLGPEKFLEKQLKLIGIEETWTFSKASDGTAGNKQS